jgi:hypothetical protein
LTEKQKQQKREQNKMAKRDYTLKGNKVVKTNRPAPDGIIKQIGKLGISKLKRVEASGTYIKPEQVPLGSGIEGKLIGVPVSTSKKVDGCNLLIKDGERQFLFPVTGTIAFALTGGMMPDKKSKTYGADLSKAIEKHVGKQISVVRDQKDQPSPGNKNNPMRMFSVYLK